MRQLLLALISLGYSQAADEDCFDGFHLVPGTIRRDSLDGQIKGGLDTDEEGCAKLCSKGYKDCCSYEHSTSKNICNLNKECKPTEDQNEDFKFCVKDRAGKSRDEGSDDLDYGLHVHGSVIGSNMYNAGDNEVIVEGNIENSNVRNYDGKVRQSSQCLQSYNILNQDWRKVKYTPGGAKPCKLHCDISTFVPGWYRFKAPAGEKIPISPPSFFDNDSCDGLCCDVCQTAATAWIKERRDPVLGDEPMTINICFAHDGECRWKNTGKAVACKDDDGIFYLYYLERTPGCPMAYCAI